MVKTTTDNNTKDIDYHAAAAESLNTVEGMVI